MPTEKSPQPRAPAVGDDPREATTDVQPPDGKVRFRHLDEAVIEADRCVQCGSCVAACPSDSIGIADSDRRPTLVKMCTGCSRCWDTCPRAGLRYERLPTLDGADPETVDGGIGPIEDGYAASAAADVAGAQHGGVVTALLAALLESPDGIDGAVVATEATDGTGLAEPALATTPAEVQEYAGTLFTQPLQLAALEELLADADLPADPSLALVGTPCVIEGVTALDRSPYRDDRFDESRPLDHVDLTVALTCTQALDDEGLEHVLSREYGLDPDDVAGLDLVGQGIRIDLTDGGDERAPLGDFRGAILDGCLECADATGGRPTSRLGPSAAHRGSRRCWSGPSVGQRRSTVPRLHSTPDHSKPSRPSNSSHSGTRIAPERRRPGISTPRATCGSPTAPTGKRTMTPTARRSRSTRRAFTSTRSGAEMSDMRQSTADEETTEDAAQSIEDDHLEDVEDGCGCAEVWEHLSEQREDT